MRKLLIPLTLLFVSSASGNLRDLDLRTFKVVATVMTSKTGGARLADGGKNTADKEVFVALPSCQALGREVEVKSLETGVVVRGIPVRDVGPHSVKDPYWDSEKGRPLAERGLSDKYGKAKNTAGIDLSLKLCKALSLSYPYKGPVEWKFCPVRGE